MYSIGDSVGISKENRGSAVFGMNPNLNIEDEYIENLVKQIHFMSMEVKLLKEKQQQSAGNGLWGVINRVNQPLVKDIVDSNQKYHSMKKTVDTDVNVPLLPSRTQSTTTCDSPTSRMHSSRNWPTSKTKSALSALAGRRQKWQG